MKSTQFLFLILVLAGTGILFAQPSEVYNLTKEKIKSLKVKSITVCDLQQSIKQDTAIIKGQKIPYGNMIPKDGKITMHVLSGKSKDPAEKGYDKIYYEDKARIPSHSRTYQYDENNELIFREIVKTIEYSFDKSGNIIEQKYDDPGVTWDDKIQKYRYNFIYSPAGELIEKNYYDSDGKMTKKKIDNKADVKKDAGIKKDNKGNIIQEEGMDEIGKYRFKYIYEYDAGGNIIKTKVMESREADGYKNEVISDQRNFKYKNGKMTEKETILGENGTKIFYTYDENGNCLTHGQYHSGGGDLFFVNEFKYNSQGLIIEDISYSVNGTKRVSNRRSVFEYTYH